MNMGMQRRTQIFSLGEGGGGRGAGDGADPEVVYKLYFILKIIS